MAAAVESLDFTRLAGDPVRLAKVLWPDVSFYKEQQDLLRSVWINRETYVYTGNKQGKGFAAGKGITMFFLTRNPCRIVTTSTKDLHLNVLWDEIHQSIRTSAVPLTTATPGGSLVVNQRQIRRKGDEMSYIIGMVASEDTVESFQGHHVASKDGLPRALMVGDEACSLRDSIRKMTTSWAHSSWWFGNTWPCENFFKHALKGKPGTKDRGGDIPREGGGFLRKVFRWTAEQSPNVRLARIQMAAGIEPTNEIVVPGVLSWREYQEARLLWDPVQQKVSLDAEFPEGAETKMFPPEWLDRAEEIARKGGYGSQAEAMGNDSGQGGDNSAFAVVHRRALLELIGIKTPDTAVVVDTTVELLRRYPSLRPEKVCFDLGGGGKEHVDRLRRMGYEVTGVWFGGIATPEPGPGVVTLDDKIRRGEVRGTYKNKRAEMYATLRRYLNPAEGYDFALPGEVLNRPRSDGGPSLREQMQAVPLEYDDEGRMAVRPKTRRDKKDTRETLTEMIGCSPDELDALVVAVYRMETEEKWATVGVGY